MFGNRSFRVTTVVLAAVLLVFVALIGLSSRDGVVVAQAEATPTPYVRAEDDGVHGELDGTLPAVYEGDAEWTLGERQFAPLYPEGFRFEVDDVTSSSGEIVNARVVWTHAPGSNTRRSVGADYDSDSGMWVAYWEAGNNQVPPWVLIRYRWEFTDEAGNRYITGEIDEVYEDVENAELWGHAESDDVVVHWIGLPDEVGEQAIDAMAERREFYRQAWGGLLPYRPRVILYGWSEFQRYEEFMGRPVMVGGTITAGTTRGDWGSSVQIATPGSDTTGLTYHTVLHEVGHLYQDQFTRVTVDWFIEGNAEFFALNRSDYRDWAQSRLMSDDPLSFEAGFSIRGENFRDGYWLGTTVWDYLVETYSLDAHRQVWELISANVPRFEAIEIVTGISIQQFEQDWRTWLGVNSPPPTLAPSPTPPVDIFSFPTPTFAPAG